MPEPRPTAESDAPTCRSCYARTLSKDARERFYAEPVTSCIYYCPEHQKVEDDLLARIDWSKIIMRKPGETLPAGVGWWDSGAA